MHQEKMPIPLRGHHLKRIRDVSNMDPETYTKLLTEQGYLKNHDDENGFAKKTYAFLKSLHDNLEQEVIVTAGDSDYICNECTKKSNCSDHNTTKNNKFGAFYTGNATNLAESRDNSATQDLGLEVGKIYKVRQIINATKDKDNDLLT